MGFRPTEITKQKISKSCTGRKLTEETKKKIGLANKGKKLSEEHKKWISLYKTGKKHSEETKRKISESNRGKKHTEITKLRMSSARKGKNAYQFTDEVREKISATLKQKGISPPHHKGIEHYNWQGGISFEPYSTDWTRSLRISIRERDKYTCRLCGEKQEEKAHAIHHIDYNKKNCDPNNLITLCQSCHAKTGKNRGSWIIYFKELKI